MTVNKIEDNNAQEYKTKESFVAFVDILGFSQMIVEDGGKGETLKVVKDAIASATKLLEERKAIHNHPYAFWYKEFQVKSFSDCFCFSIPLEFDNGEKDYKQNFVAFYVWIQAFCNTLLKAGFLCRGGITQGWHYSDDKIIFSKALVDAYLLESKKANHPLILIHQDLIDNLVQKGFGEQHYYQYMFVHDTTGRSFLHPFNYSIVDELFFGFVEQVNGKLIEERSELIEVFLSIIERNIEKLIGRSEVDKWQWLKEFSHYTLSGQYYDRFSPGLFRSRKGKEYK
ncbi:hypothetical protein GCM10023093_21800 [Nemorincola caseinilytica]|uniref:Guanylate cyclase domain-containing protein n=1 Tax=Nemorincola caseinilytica TaxID=2054315 RepID=A0ABP8NKD3_9BACT